MEVIAREWVDGSPLLYIGKADRLRWRLREFARFGADEPVAHRGGRLIWQLADAQELLVAWRDLDTVAGETTAREVERALPGRFSSEHDERRPFANLTG